jgi:hypothetical protein
VTSKTGALNVGSNEDHILCTLFLKNYAKIILNQILKSSACKQLAILKSLEVKWRSKSSTSPLYISATKRSTLLHEWIKLMAETCRGICIVSVRYLFVTNSFYVCQIHRRCNKVDAKCIVLCLYNATFV